MISRDDYARSSRTAPNPRPHFASHFELDHINPHVTKPVWMVHNHPSGVAEPSQADLVLTRRAAPVPFPHAIADAARSRPPEQTPTLNSADLLGSSREIVMQHGTEAYRLRLTRHDKLILTK